jgi:hypothetical protein
MLHAPEALFDHLRKTAHHRQLVRSITLNYLYPKSLFQKLAIIRWSDDSLRDLPLFVQLCTSAGWCLTSFLICSECQIIRGSQLLQKRCIHLEELQSHKEPQIYWRFMLTSPSNSRAFSLSRNSHGRTFASSRMTSKSLSRWTFCLIFRHRWRCVGSSDCAVSEGISGYDSVSRHGTYTCLGIQKIDTAQMQKIEYFVRVSADLPMSSTYEAMDGRFRSILSPIAAEIDLVRLKFVYDCEVLRVDNVNVDGEFYSDDDNYLDIDNPTLDGQSLSLSYMN